MTIMGAELQAAMLSSASVFGRYNSFHLSYMDIAYKALHSIASVLIAA